MTHSDLEKKFQSLLTFLSYIDKECPVLILVNNVDEFSYLQIHLSRLGISYFVSYIYTPQIKAIGQYELIFEYPDWHLNRKDPEKHLERFRTGAKDYYSYNFPFI